MSLSLGCYVLGDDDDPNRIFMVGIDLKKDTVYTLKRAIKDVLAEKPGFNNVDLDTLRLWNQPCPTTPSSHFKEQLQSMTFVDDSCLIPTRNLSEVFAEHDPAPNFVHVFIRIPPVFS